MVAAVPKIGVVGLFLLASLSACATNPPAQGPAPSSSPDHSAAAALADSVRSSYTDADVAFMTGMIGHHAQALTMSAMAPENGAGAEMLVLTSRIINAQRDEINLMQRWLAKNGLPVPEIHPAGMNMEMGGESHMMMPGMLSAEQLAKLKAARGIQFERLFLQYMIMHHQGAMTMVDELFSSYGAGQQDQIFKFASDVYADQSTEVARMQLMLIERLGGSTSR